MRSAIKLLGIAAAFAGAAFTTTVIHRHVARRRLERKADAALEGVDEAEVFFVPVVEEAVIVEELELDR